jgi:3-amino-5-hydroxybenzoate synthase
MSLINWPSFTLEDKDRVLEVLDSSNLWRGNAKYLFELEHKFGTLHDAKYALATTSGTHALEIAIESAGIGFGDEVLIPAFTFIATATAVLMRNAFPIPVEVNLNNYCMDHTQIEKQITPRTKGIIPVHIAGHSCNMSEILKIAKKYKLAVIEDCAHSHGSSYKGKPLGSLGDFGTFSFQAIKTMTAGEGGLLITNNDSLWSKAYSFFNCGRVPDGSSYDHISLSSNYRMSEIQAALLVGQIDKLKKQIDKRRENVLYLNSVLESINGIFPQSRADFVTVQGYSMYMFRYKSEAFNCLSRDEFVHKLNQSGFPASKGYPVFFSASFFKNLYYKRNPLSFLPNRIDYDSFNLPIASTVSVEVIWLPHFFLFSDKGTLLNFGNTIKKIQNEL